jgi:hypothetical protein
LPAAPELAFVRPQPPHGSTSAPSLELASGVSRSPDHIPIVLA